MSNDAPATRDVGVVGLAVMGENLTLNIERNGFSPAVYNRTSERTTEFVNGRAAGTSVLPTYDLREFVNALERPRRIMLMVKAGAPVDDTIEQLSPYLEPGDILVDGGNSLFTDSERRSNRLASQGLHFVGMGVSGGELGALWGPSLMPGSSTDAYAALEGMLTAISAKSDSGPCVTHVGPGGAGHYVKMVHNGIEYGDMQLIAETYDIMRRALGMSATEIADVFARWNEGVLESFLVETTATVLRYIDPETEQPLVDLVLDQAEQKGTGRWTSQNSYELGTPIPVIDAAVTARIMSSYKAERVEASTLLTGPGGDGQPLPPAPDREQALASLEQALYFAKISCYAQGMALLSEASKAYGWNIRLSEIARIWKAGCIIRASLLDPIMKAFEAGEPARNLLFDPYFTRAVNNAQPHIRQTLKLALDFGIPTPAISTALNYVDSYRTASLPANLIQAQRDFFGAHTYRRTDRDGTFHTEWSELDQIATLYQ